MNELDIKNLSDEVIEEINSQISGNFRIILDTSTELYMRRMLLAYHQELINKKYVTKKELN